MFDEYRSVIPEKNKGYDIDIIEADFASIYADNDYPVTIETVEKAVDIVKNNPKYFISVFRIKDIALVEYIKKEIPRNVIND